MTCEDYLALLETLPLAELSYGEAREHCAQCHDCNRVTRVVAERERSMMLAFGMVYPASSAPAVAGAAVAMARRRRLATYYRAALGVAAAGVLAYIIGSRTVHPSPAMTHSQSFRLQCLSPDIAAEAVRPALSDRASIMIRPPGTSIVVRGTPEEVARAGAILGRMDRDARRNCAVRVIVPE